MNAPLETTLTMNDSTTKTIAVLGGTGGTGRSVVEAARAAGHHVRLLTRRDLTLEDDGIEVVQGDARDPEAVREVVRGADAVVIALGRPPKDKSGLRTAGTRVALDAMRSEGVDRVVALSMLGVGEDKRGVDWFTRTFVVGMWLRNVDADHTAQEAELRASGLSWTAVRPPHLTDGPATGTAAVGFSLDERPPSMKVSRADVAALMLRCALSDEYSGQAVGIAG